MNSHTTALATEDDELAEFRAQVREIAVEKIAPHAAETDATGMFPQASWDAMRSASLTGLPFPEEYGGQGADLMAQVVCIEETARVCSTSALTLLGSWVGLHAALAHGAPELLQEIVPGAASGVSGVSFSLTEPHSGSDLASLSTRGQPDGDGWMLDGRKCFITNAGWSDWYAVLARTGDKGYAVFMVHRDDPGVSFGRPEKKMGHRGSPTADVLLESCRIPGWRVVGDPGQGYDYIMGSLVYSRPIIAAQALGIAQGALDESIRYTAERDAFGQKVSRFQLVRGMVADMAVRVESSRALLYHTVRTIMRGGAHARAEAAMAKLLCTDTAMAVTTDAVQLHGGYGYLSDFPVERMMRDAKITQIYEGTNQIQRLLIAKSLYARAGGE
ncbi:acyl-CoA dehydrogenase family protein [Pseudonocardia sp. MH-G8]|uniref:acyl-CoA dehydrogenase family protein n=1 Tax=Pseudonocardia sp. MH-G8 TaxID=1854588 RepID=UPI000BA0626E|nr:acyl-CoA dehydrogenase family protein [Pseudonocardia sp. MH-G8]OZM77930.1 acyl-CoA dehydrogenase [Pseudonocardia sp. MH-G8]